MIGWGGGRVDFFSLQESIFTPTARARLFVYLFQYLFIFVLFSSFSWEGGGGERMGCGMEIEGEYFTNAKPKIVLNSQY